MKHLCLIFFCVIISFSTWANTQQISFRNFYYDVCLKKKSIHDFDSYLKLHENNSSIFVESYRSVIWFLWADYYVNPLKKWSCFLKGKKALDGLIASNPNNLETRFLRLTIQENIPKILGYDESIEEDKNYIIKNLNRISDKDLITRIINYIYYQKLNKTA